MTEEYAERKVEAIRAVYKDLCEVLDGHGAVVQGGALADALATWLAGHVVRGDASATHAMREELLQTHIDSVRELIAPNAKRMGLPE